MALVLEDNTYMDKRITLRQIDYKKQILSVNAWLDEWIGSGTDGIET